MLPIPPGWIRRWQADHVLLKFPGRPVGVLKYRENWGPLRSMRQFLEERLPRLPVGAPEILKIHPIERLATEEGEHAAIARVDLRCALTRDYTVKHPAAVFFGCVFGDNFMTSLDGLCLSPPHFDELHVTVRDLTRRTVLLLGNPRRRRFFYRMPPLWQPLKQSWGTRLIPPEYPKVGAMITVHAAMPKTASRPYVEAVMQEQTTRGALVNAARSPELVTLPSELRGSRWQFVSQQADKTQRVHVVVELSDSRYIYRLKLDTAADVGADVRQIFDALCMSIEPVPATSQNVTAIAAVAAASTLDFWAD